MTRKVYRDPTADEALANIARERGETGRHRAAGFAPVIEIDVRRALTAYTTSSKAA